MDWIKKSNEHSIDEVNKELDELKKNLYSEKIVGIMGKIT